MNWYLKALTNYMDFSGRARRKEYWFFILFNLLISVALTIIDGVIGLYSIETGVGLFSGIYSLVILIPSIAVGVRRLHDTNRSGWWLLILFIPLIGVIILIVFMASDSNPEKNQYGPNPKTSTAKATTA
jgi:uncharacterized membrane protein YhaH (DUF805 family)